MCACSRNFMVFLIQQAYPLYTLHKAWLHEKIYIETCRWLFGKPPGWIHKEFCTGLGLANSLTSIKPAQPSPARRRIVKVPTPTKASYSSVVSAATARWRRHLHVPAAKQSTPAFSFASRQPASRPVSFLPSISAIHLAPPAFHCSRSSISLQRQQHCGVRRRRFVLIMRLWPWPWRRKPPPPHADDVPVAVGTHLHVDAPENGDQDDAVSAASSESSAHSHLTLPVHAGGDDPGDGVRHTHYEVAGSGSEESEIISCSESDGGDQSAETNVVAGGRQRRRPKRHHRRGGRRRRPAGGGIPALIVVGPAAAVMLLALVALVAWKRRQRRML